MADKLEVVLSADSFDDAGGSKKFSNLRVGDSVNAEVNSPRKGQAAAVVAANEALAEAARKSGYTHVFGIEYNLDGDDDCNFTSSPSGVGYGPRG